MKKVTTIEINEAKMNLMLAEMIDKNKLEIRPKNNSENVNLSGTILHLISKIAAEIENNIVTSI